MIHNNRLQWGRKWRDATNQNGIPRPTWWGRCLFNFNIWHRSTMLTMSVCYRFFFLMISFAGWHRFGGHGSRNRSHQSASGAWWGESDAIANGDGKRPRCFVLARLEWCVYICSGCTSAFCETTVHSTSWRECTTRAYLQASQSKLFVILLLSRTLQTLQLVSTRIYWSTYCSSVHILTWMI